MSYQGQTWVDTVALPLLKNQGELLVMLRVANRASNGAKNMSGCYASAASLGVECLMHPDTVRTHLRALRKRGLLVPGDPQKVSHLPADKRPPVYDLAGAHEPGCIGGHTDLDDCQTVASAQIEQPKEPSSAGRRITDPSKGAAKEPSSAGRRITDPVADDGGAGRRITVQRVGESPTKGSKELKDLSLVPDAPPVPSDSGIPVASATDERERGAARDKTTATPSASAASVPGPRTTDDQKTADAVAMLTDLPARLGKATVTRLAPLAAAAFADGWTVETLRAELNERVDVSKIRSRGALPRLYEDALNDLPAAPSAQSAGGRERCPDHPGRYRRGCIDCAMAVPA